MDLKIYILLVQVCFSNHASALNILGIFEVPSQSHSILGQELLVGLAKRGHNVTLMSSFPMNERIPNYTHIQIDNLLEYKQNHLNSLFQGQSKLGILSNLNMQTHLVNLTMQSKAVKDLLEFDNKYDVVIQAYTFNEAYLGLAQHFNARVIGYITMSATQNAVNLMGSSAPYSYVPQPFFGLTDNMNFFERTINTLISIAFNLVHRYYLYPQQMQLLEKYFPEYPPLDEIERERVDLFFCNANFGNESPRPRTPNIINIGGYHVQQPQALDPNLQIFLDNAKEGVVYLGFGTNVDTKQIPKEKMDAFLSKFAKLSYKVLMKHDGIIHNKPENVKIMAWIPQKGVLGHPNTKIFISHGGKGSATESLYYGVPVLCISFFGDQDKNCKDIVQDGYGVYLPYNSVTEESFAKAFDELNNNTMYRQNVEYRSALFREQEIDPLDRANFWIEHVYKFKGAKHLLPKSATMPLYQYLLLDVWAFIMIVMLLVFLILYNIIQCLVKCIYRFFSGVGSKDKEKRN